MWNLRKYLGVAVGITLMVILMFHGRLRDYDEGRYQDPPPPHIAKLNKIQFEDVTQSFGLGDAKHNLFTPNKSEILNKYLPFLTVRPYVSVLDLNKDGYMDLFFLETLPDKPSQLYLNDKGKGFIDITDRLDILKEKGEYSTSVATWADFNNDGKLDFFTSSPPCYRMFLQTGDMQFEEVKNALNYCSVPTVMNVFDFNRDGNLDIGVGNYFPPSMTRDPSDIFQQLIGLATNLKKRGEPNLIFLGDGTGKFNTFQPATFLNDKGGTTAFGVAYIDNDMWPDIFIGNDYTFDEMYLNKNGTDIIKVTDHFIPRFYHGFSGMNSDFADYNLDGQLDLFVTNGWGPPSATAENLLWRKSPEGDRFIESAKDQNVFKCGWAWGAKFADYDLDGDLDLFVTNGRSKGRKATSFKNSQSFNYLRTQVRSMPTFLREKLIHLADDKLPDLTNSDFQYYGFERNCMFSQHEGKFYDVAPFSGVDDLENGRSVVTLDIENDGKMDIAIGNTDAPLILYRNISQTKGNWVGFSLENKLGLPFHGAAVTAIRSDDKSLREELFIGNGGRGMNDPRINFGLGSHTLKPTP